MPAKLGSRGTTDAKGGPGGTGKLKSHIKTGRGKDQKGKAGRERMPKQPEGGGQGKGDIGVDPTVIRCREGRKSLDIRRPGTT